MATSTKTITNLYNFKIDIKENELFSVIKIFNEKKTSDRINDINGRGTNLSNGYVSYKVEECEYYDVYIKPVNGSIITSCSRAESWKSFTRKEGTNIQTDSWSDEYPNFDIGQELEWDDVYLNNPSCFNLSTDQTDYHFDGSGCIYIGEEYTEKYTSTEVHTDLDENYSYKEYHEFFNTCEYNIDGELNYLDVKVIGNKSADKFIYYTLNGENDDQKTYILRVTPSKQTYTNEIMFNEKYEMNGSNLPSYFSVINICNVPGKVIMTKTSDEFNHQESYTELLSMEPSELDVFNQLYYVPGSIENKIRSVLIYVDCAFAVFTPSWPSSIGEHYFYSTYKDAKNYEESYIKQNGIVLNNFQCYDLLMRCNRSDKYLYLSHNDFIKKLSPDGQPQLTTRVSNPLETNIPKEHRWVQLLGLTWYNRLTGYNAIVRLVDKNNQASIKDIVTVEDGYVRFTTYWFAKTYKPENNFVVQELCDLSYTRNIIGNRIYYPIVKPWAAVHMNVFPEQENNEAFGCTRRRNLIYKTVKSKLDKYFFNIYLIKRYYRKINIDADSDFEVVFEKIKEYGRTLSPFRVETFTCHGSRREYDKDSQSLDGMDAIAMSKNKRFKRTGWDKIHDIANQYNESIFSNNNMYWNVFVESCFGQGIKTEQTRGCDINSNFINSTYDVLPSGYNAFVIFSAAGTHCGYGNTLGFSNESIYMNKVMSDTITYQELSDNFNNLVKNCKEQTFKIIRDFYNNNFSEMLFCLKDYDYRYEWGETKELISEDLYNQGRKYFTQYDWEKTLDNGNPNPYYNASDNYFDIPEREYRINDGFIGLIKDAMCELTSNNNPWKCFKEFSNPQGMELLYEGMVGRCKNNIKRCGEQIQSLHRNALSTKYYELASVSSIIEPRMFVTGKLKNAKFLDYPEEEAEMKKWLTSDDDVDNLFAVSVDE